MHSPRCSTSADVSLANNTRYRKNAPKHRNDDKTKTFIEHYQPWPTHSCGANAPFSAVEQGFLKHPEAGWQEQGLGLLEVGNIILDDEDVLAGEAKQCGAVQIKRGTIPKNIPSKLPRGEPSTAIYFPICENRGSTHMRHDEIHFQKA